MSCMHGRFQAGQHEEQAEGTTATKHMKQIDFAVMQGFEEPSMLNIIPSMKCGCMGNSRMSGRSDASQAFSLSFAQEGL